MEEETSQLKDRIKRIRKEAGYTQKDFANCLGLSRNFIIQLESGEKRPSGRTLMQISETFHINLEWLKTGNGERQENVDFPVLEKVEKLASEKRFSVVLILSVLASLNDKELTVLDNILHRTLLKGE